jgi:hypothetical protein
VEQESEREDQTPHESAERDSVGDVLADDADVGRT